MRRAWNCSVAAADNRPQQARSRRTELAIVDALSELLRHKPFADITVAEIATAAGVSVGGFYARFASKEALLELVELTILDEFTAQASEQLDPARFAGQGIAAVTRAYAELLITNFRSRRLEIVRILRFTQPRSPTEDRLRQFNVGVHDRVRALLRERSAEIAGPDVEQTINLGLAFTSAAARDAVLTRNLEVYPVTLDDQQLIAAIDRLFCSYLSRCRCWS